MVTPLVQQSAGRLKGLASTIRRQQFVTKTEAGPQTVQALAEAGLEQERLERQATSRIALQAQVQRESIEATRERTGIFGRQVRGAEKAREAEIKRSRIKGGITGAGGGAAAGFLVGGPVGGVVGGIIGAVTGGK